MCEHGTEGRGLSLMDSKLAPFETPGNLKFYCNFFGSSGNEIRTLCHLCYDFWIFPNDELRPSIPILKLPSSKFPNFSKLPPPETTNLAHLWLCCCFNLFFWDVQYNEFAIREVLLFTFFPSSVIFLCIKSSSRHQETTITIYPNGNNNYGNDTDKPIDE